MACKFYLEYGNKKIGTKDIENKVKEVWKEKGNRVKDIIKLDIYFKAEEGMCYYVINEEVRGGFPLDVFEEE